MVQTTLDDLYRAKGEAVTQLEVWQARLNDFNRKIIEELNKQAAVEKEAKESCKPT